MNPLHPDLLGYFMIVLLVPVAILQWCIVLPLARKHNVLKTLKDHPDLPAEEGTEKVRRIPLIQDGFFILWNLLPIVGALIYGIIWYNWGTWYVGFEQRFGPGEIGDTYDRWIAQFRFHFAYIPILAALSILACFMQIPKQRRFFQENTAYWWDWRISKRIFLVRLICLFFNMFAVLFYGTGIILLFILVTDAASSLDPKPALLHPDGMAGFKSLGNLCFWLSIAFLYTAGMSLAGVFDHWKQGLTHNLSDFASLGFCFLAGVWILVYPAMTINSKLSARYQKLITISTQLTEKTLSELSATLEKEENPAGQKKIDHSKLDQWLDKNAAKLLVLRQIQETKTSPIGTSDVVSMFSTFLLPFLIWVFFKLLDAVYKRRRAASEESANPA